MRVLIVGGGPAGLSAAKALAQRGHEVFLVERGNIGEPVRSSGGIVVEEFKKVYPNVDGFYRPVTRGGFILDTGEVYEAELPKDAFGVLDVRSLYQRLAEEAIESGATIEVHAAAKDVRISSNGVKSVFISTPEGEFRISADVYVDATGSSSRLISKLSPRRLRLATGVEIDAYVTDERTRILLGDSFKGGYGRVFNRKPRRSRIGIGIIGGGRLMSTLRKVIEVRQEATGGKALGGIEFHSGTFNASGPRSDYRVKNVIAIGDAGGFGSPAYGEGIRFAIESGKLLPMELEREGYLLRYWKEKYGKLYEYGLRAQSVAAKLGTRERKRILDALWPEIEERPERLIALMKLDVTDDRLRGKLKVLAREILGALL